MIQGPQDINIITIMGHFDYVAPAKAIKPHRGDLTAPWQAPAWSSLDRRVYGMDLFKTPKVNRVRL